MRPNLLTTCPHCFGTRQITRPMEWPPRLLRPGETGHLDDSVTETCLDCHSGHFAILEPGPGCAFAYLCAWLEQRTRNMRDELSAGHAGEYAHEQPAACRAAADYLFFGAPCYGTHGR